MLQNRAAGLRGGHHASAWDGRSQTSLQDEGVDEVRVGLDYRRWRMRGGREAG